MSVRFVPVSYCKEKIGKHIKGSKIKHLWNFVMGEQEICLLLFESKISGKRMLVVNGETQVACKQNKEETITASVYNNSITVFKEHDGNFTLKFENKFFRTEDFNGKHVELKRIPTNNDEDQTEQPERNLNRLDTEYLAMDETNSMKKPQVLYNSFI